MVAPAVIIGGMALAGALGKMRGAKSSNENRNNEFSRTTTPFGGQQSEQMIHDMLGYYKNLVSNPQWSLGQFGDSRNMLGSMKGRYFPGMNQNQGQQGGG